MADAPRISQLFSASDADITFSSSDGVLFKIHRKYLDTAAGAFPPADIPTNNELVSLTESSDILELLFRFAYPKHHPDIDDVAPFVTFASLAEAAEKYEMYAAVNVCRLRMRYRTAPNPKFKNPMDLALVLAYACKHGYMDIADMAAPLTIGMPHANVVALLTPLAVLPYLKYVAHWQIILHKGIKIFEGKGLHRDHMRSCDGSAIVQVLVRFGVGMESLLDFPAILQNITSSCGVCTSLRADCRDLVTRLIGEVPNFSVYFPSHNS